MKNKKKSPSVHSVFTKAPRCAGASPFFWDIVLIFDIYATLAGYPWKNPVQWGYSVRSTLFQLTVPSNFISLGCNSKEVKIDQRTSKGEGMLGKCT